MKRNLLLHIFGILWTAGLILACVHTAVEKDKRDNRARENT
jgi:hypothetical protein